VQAVNDETPLYTLPVTIDLLVDGKPRRFQEKVDKKEHLFFLCIAPRARTGSL